MRFKKLYMSWAWSCSSWRWWEFCCLFHRSGLSKLRVIFERKVGQIGSHLQSSGKSKTILYLWKCKTLTSPHSQTAELYVFHAGLYSLVLQEDFTSLRVLYLSLCFFPKDRCWFPEKLLRAAVCAGVKTPAPRDLAPRDYRWTSVPILLPACSSTISSTSLQPCCRAAAAFLPYRAGSLLRSSGECALCPRDDSCLAAYEPNIGLSPRSTQKTSLLWISIREMFMRSLQCPTSSGMPCSMPVSGASNHTWLPQDWPM